MVGVDQRPELGRGVDPRRRSAASARGAVSANRNRSATELCTCTRSTDPQDWPAPANAEAATCSAAHAGIHARVDDRQVAARGLLARAHHEVDAGVRAQRARGALVAVQELQDRAEVEQLGQPLGRQRRLLGRLEHDRVAAHQRRAERAAARGQRIAPGHQDRHDAARVAQDQVAARRAAALQGPDLRVGLERADGRLDAAERVRQRRPGLERLQRRQLAGVLAQPPGRRLQQRAARLRREPRPRPLRGARGEHRVVGLGDPSGRDVADRFAGGRVEHGELGNPAGDTRSSTWSFALPLAPHLEHLWSPAVNRQSRPSVSLLT